MSAQAHDPIRYASVYSSSAPPRTPWSTYLVYLLAAFGLLTILARLSTTRRRLARKSSKQKPRRRKSRQAAVSPAGSVTKAPGEETLTAAGLEIAREEAAGVAASELSDGSETDSEEDAADYTAAVGDTVTNAMVRGAVLLKRSPIPDFLVSMTGYGLEGYKRVNSAFGVEEKIVHAGQKAVSAGITATGIFAHAAIKAGVAYQMAPGRRENELQMLAIKPQAEPVKIVRKYATLNGDNGALLPGGVASEAETQTCDSDFEDSGGSGSAGVDRSGSPLPSLLTTGGRRSAPASPGVSGVLASYLESTLRVAGNVATAGSEVVLGKDRTLRLLGVDPIEARRRNPEVPEDGLVRYISVGGVVHATTVETLTRVDASLLAEWFRNRTRPAALEIRDGCYFIDRDGTMFRHILNYLRGVPTHTTITDADSLTHLADEAAFYRLPDLAAQLTARIEVLRHTPPESVSDLLLKLRDKIIPVEPEARAATVNTALGAAVVAWIAWFFVFWR
ncbi:BTB/POZ domain-containing protein kctd1 [Geranomyces variabilis]|uniref:BTB/POZ domain-containing protein kctd1 n=1 Tax=Geranomyces variabilis TaxID=109894 RepID=A0AAD5TSW5_9FUNG|nr:BTB/POZ domain-containing protein kctd1 [Geranomyces variabilis]